MIGQLIHCDPVAIVNWAKQKSEYLFITLEQYYKKKKNNNLRLRTNW